MPAALEDELARQPRPRDIGVGPVMKPGHRADAYRPTPTVAAPLEPQSTLMTTVGISVRVVGELFADEDVVIAGRIDGDIVCERSSVVVLQSAEVVGDVIGRDITVHGRVSGRLIATEFVDLAAEAIVAGPVMAPRFILAEGARFTGRVEPQHVDAAIRVARFERQKRNGTATAG
jgi:cytoskeletal protein CcmA (bactofilin family)